MFKYYVDRVKTCYGTMEYIGFILTKDNAYEQYTEGYYSYNELLEDYPEFKNCIIKY